MSATTALDALGAAASVLTVLDASIKTFSAIVSIAHSLAQYTDKTASVIQQCQFDSQTLENLINIFKANPSLLSSERDWENTERVFDQLFISLLKIKARLEPYKQSSLLNRVMWTVTMEKVALELEQDLFRWSQRLYMRLSLLMSHFHDTIGQQQVSPLLRVPELMSGYRMNEIITKANELSPSTDHLHMDIKNVQLLGPPSSRMMASLKNDKKALVEFRPYGESADQTHRTLAELDARRLAAILSHAKPSLMCILPCIGYYHDEQHHRFSLLFSLPTGMSDPNGLMFLDKLIAKERRYSLSKRIEIARRVAAALFVTHAIKWVHRSIQARKILICPRGGIVSGEAYLTGFEVARDVHGISDGTETDVWEDRLYRHPDRQSEKDNPLYVPAYDIYSLGVVLIEIGRWKTCASDMEKEGEKTFGKMPGDEFKKYIIKKFLPAVSHHVGESYAGIVGDCLNAERGQGMKLIGDILSRLEKLQDSI